MKIVIDIPQGLKIDFENENWTALTCAEMKEALMHGTPLPEGHNRLIDGDALEDRLDWLEKVTNEDSMIDKAKHDMLMECIRIVRTTPTIIESDKEKNYE